MGTPDIREALRSAGQVGPDLLTVNWASTPLGPPEEWPQSLKTLVRVLLGSRFSMWMAWGPELTFFCNDAYRRDTLGRKYPWALGRPAREVWAEIWPDIGPRIAHVMAEGEATWDEGLLLFLARSGYVEETYHTFSYSPVSDDDGSVVGMLCVVSEDTKRVIGERRMTTLRDLGSDLSSRRSEADVLAAVRSHIGANGRDFPFSIIYLFDAGQRTAAAAVCTGAVEGDPVAPSVIDATSDHPWPAEAALRGESTVIDDLAKRWSELPTGDWKDPPAQALVTPLRPQGDALPYGFLVAGLNPYVRLDAEYRGFIELVAGQVAAAIASGRAYDAERRRAEELAELDRAKTAFFTNVSHEFRTPLTLILGPAEDALLDQSAPVEGINKHRVELIRSNAQRLLVLVNTLLDFSRLQSGHVNAGYEPVDLPRYTAELAAMFRPATDRAGLTLSVDCPPLSQPVFVDREMWAKVVLNLLSNALKFTFSGGITVRLRETGEGAELSVADTGIGIAPADQSRLFERFHRVVGARSRSFEGSGIGLALVAELARLHGGNVTVHSQPGAGSTFSVTIPFGAAHLPHEEIRPAPRDSGPVSPQAHGLVAEAMRWLQANDQAPSTVAPGRESDPDGPGETRPRVLVVDDNAEMRKYLSEILGEMYSVETAVDGAVAVEKACSNPPALVVTDVMMPNLDGFGLLAALRDDPATAAVPVIMLSARAGEDGIVEGLEAGADDYLVKPFSARELLARVRTNVELDRAQRARRELERSQSLLDQAQRLAELGSWELDLGTGDLTGSEQYFRIMDVDRQEVRKGGLSAALTRVHPEDRASVEAMVHAAPGQVSPDGVFRVVRLDGEVRLVRLRGEAATGPDGRAMVRGSVQDITEQRQAERALAEAAAQRHALAREHQIADELQASLLPDQAFEHDYLEVATFYQAGVEGTYVGGDWYDVIELGADRTALVIGDVMGRGVRAAAVMGQLRSAVRAYARLDMAPSHVLQLLDGVVRDLSEDQIVTCIYAVYDPATRMLQYANAGHLPPMLRASDGQVLRLDGLGSPPLGTRPLSFKEHHVRVDPGGTVVFYTDGLVERRGRDLDRALDYLASYLETAGEEELARQPRLLVSALLPEGPDDDVAVLMARVPPVAGALGGATPGPLEQAEQLPGPGWGQTAEVVLEQESGAVPASRRFARSWLSAADRHLEGDVEVVLSELVTNAVLHGEPPLTLRLARVRQGIRVEVEDTGFRLPVRLQGSSEAMTGRGLALVAALARDWGVSPAPVRGKVVWAEITSHSGRSPDRGPSQSELNAIINARVRGDEDPERFTVRLGAVPTDLLLAAKSHVDNVVRELDLLRGEEARSGVALAPEIAALVEAVTGDFAEARNEIKRQAAAAAARGEPVTNLELHLPLSVADAGERYLDALDQVDRYARAAKLLTLAPPRAHRIFRRWYVRSLIDQLRLLALGESPPEAPSFMLVLADEINRLSEQS